MLATILVAAAFEGVALMGAAHGWWGFTDTLPVSVAVAFACSLSLVADSKRR